MTRVRIEVWVSGDLCVRMSAAADQRDIDWSAIGAAAFEAALEEKSVVEHLMSENRELQDSVRQMRAQLSGIWG